MNYSLKQFENAQSRDKIECVCEQCGETCVKTRNQIEISIQRGQTSLFCNQKCFSEFIMKKETVECLQCNSFFQKRASQITKTKNHFCNRSCAAIYNNSRKTTGNRRSKLEKWLEEQLMVLYPDLDIVYSDKTTINSELDIYIPSLRLAFELNGIFHYEPIFGESKLEQIQNNDCRKFQACIENNVELCIIDTSSQKYVKPSTSQKFLDIIIKLVNLKLSKIDCVEVL